MGGNSDEPQAEGRQWLSRRGKRDRDRGWALGRGTAGQILYFARVPAGLAVVVMMGAGRRILRHVAVCDAVVRRVLLRWRGGRGVPHRGARQGEQGQREQARNGLPEPAHARRHP
ncbi:hypothetical protein [Roseicella aerolata]|uniref:Uncharacterized protein n=1 Tax=Roseicella aerolata TaxID=2883479 RepID=A0A9X1IH69_9PROT|nr:hypothetical protein [Roseicella aerolata]MCB4824490.1 hypothetical protein [Roseicella aerolata]